MEDDAPLNPYAPSASSASGWSNPEVPVRSGWLVTICVTAIALGALGALSGLTGLATLAFQKQLQTVMTPPGQGNVPPDLQEAQQKFNTQMQELQSRYAVVLGGAALAKAAIGAALVVGGIWCLRQKLTGRTTFLAALSAALVFEFANSILQVVMSLETMELTGEFFQTMAEDTPSPEVMLSVMRGIMWAGFALGLVWQAVKIGFYAAALLYLRRPAVVGQFYPDPAAAA